MKILNQLTIRMASLLVIAWANQTISAQEATSSNPAVDSEVLVLDEFVVVGSSLYSDQINALKTPTPIIDVPQSLSIINSDDIVVRGFNSIGDIIDYTPGVNNSQGEGHRDAVVFRGVRSTADFFVDGMRDDIEYYRPLYNVEQLEILRGPNALFFGRGGTGGILNRVMKKGVIGETFNGYFFSTDTFGATEVRMDSNIELNKDSAFRFNAFYEDLDNHRDFFDGDQYGVNPTIKYKIAEETTLDLSYEYLDQERFIDRGIPTGADGKPVEDFKNIIFGDPDLNTATLEAHVIRAILQHNFSENLKGNLSASYGDYDKFYQNIYASDYDQTNSPDEVTLDGYNDTTVRTNTILSGNMIGEFSTGDIGHTLIMGAEYINTRSDQDRFNSFWDISMDDTEIFSVNKNDPLTLINGTGVNANGTPTINNFSDLNDDTQVDIEVYSFYLQDEIQLLEQLQLVLGARFDSFDFSILDTTNGERNSQKDEEISPRVGIVYKPEEKISLYASYSKSFLPKSGDQFVSSNDDNLGLDPDEFTNLEAGIKWDFNQGLSLTAAVFEIEKDAAERDSNNPEIFVDVESKISGFEAQLQGTLTDKWFITAGYSYLDGEVINEKNSAVDGNRPRELPEHMFSIWNAYQLTEQFGLGLGLIYQDESYITEDNDTKLPSYVRVDAAAYYAVSENVRLQLNIENLTDELYFPNAHADHNVTVAPPINARFSIVARF